VAGAGRRARLILGCRLVDLLGESEVEDLHVAGPRDEHVLRLQVAVDDALLVGGGEAGRDLERVADRLVLRKRAAAQAPAQRVALEELGDGVDASVLAAEVVDREDVRMREGRDGERLALEARQRLGVVRHLRGENLDRDVALQLGIPRSVDLAHPARAERRDDLGSFPVVFPAESVKARLLGRILAG
jgi:hypothetical protein